MLILSALPLLTYFLVALAGIYQSYQAAYTQFKYPCLGGPSMYVRLDGGHAMKSALWSTRRLAGRVDYVHTDDGPSVIANDHSWYAIVTEAEVLDEHLDYVYRSRQPMDDDAHPSTTLATPTVEVLTFPSASAEEDEDDTDHNAWLQPSWSQYMEHLQQLQELYVASTAFPAATVGSASMVNISKSTSASIASTPSATAPPLATSEGKGRTGGEDVNGLDDTRQALLARSGSGGAVHRQCRARVSGGQSGSEPRKKGEGEARGRCHGVIVECVYGRSVLTVYNVYSQE